ncbi:hypothetical protein EIP91_010671 [Steccherinum ochraceum]|uniref:Uncharacterized protein n=1 Tax=Steccherinum ochraceum TaxID=92696 RepID=A0A4R0RLQ3_9APHY|nr:hypothetical protein EIP91_010671 [Steccherinum ochraceum]
MSSSAVLKSTTDRAPSIVIHFVEDSFQDAYTEVYTENSSIEIITEVATEPTPELPKAPKEDFLKSYTNAYVAIHYRVPEPPSPPSPYSPPTSKHRFGPVPSHVHKPKEQAPNGVRYCEELHAFVPSSARYGIRGIHKHVVCPTLTQRVRKFFRLKVKSELVLAMGLSHSDLSLISLDEAQRRPDIRYRLSEPEFTAGQLEARGFAHASISSYSRSSPAHGIVLAAFVSRLLSRRITHALHFAFPDPTFIFSLPRLHQVLGQTAFSPSSQLRSALLLPRYQVPSAIVPSFLLHLITLIR